MTDTAAIPGVLRAIRASLDLTQEQLAERLGVSFATVNRWEGGATRPQKAARLAIAALAAEVGVDNGAAAAEPERAAAQVTRRRRRSRGADLPTTKPMEQMLWDAACSIRGEKDAAKFKDYLLPLLFLKRLSDVFDDEIARLAEEYGDRAIAAEIAESDHDLLRFYLPPEARWGVVNGRDACEWPRDAGGRSTRPRDVGEHLTRAVRAVVRHNPALAGVIDVVDFAAERNGERDVNPAKLAAVVETFSDPRYRLGLADVQPDFLGRAYEYLLRKFAEGSGQSAGEFFTPTEVGFLMAHVLRPRPGETCHDYACGSAGLLVKLQLVARERDPTSRVPLTLRGQELQAESYAVAHMNAIIHDMEIEIARGDTMINPKFKTPAGRIAAHDVVVANPMWNQPFSSDLFADDPFDRFRPRGGATSGRGDWAWLQHTLACLNERGRAAVVLDTGAVTRGSGSRHEDRERNIRKWFVDRDLIDGVILLPDNLFYNTSAAGVIVVLSKRKPAARKDRIVLLNASRRVRKGRPKNFIPDDDVRPLAEAFVKGEPVEGELAVITREEAARADYNLSPSRWVGQTSMVDSGSIKDIAEAVQRLDDDVRRVGSSLAKMTQQLLTHGIRREARKETEIGPVPESWTTQPLEVLCERAEAVDLQREGGRIIKYVDVSSVSREFLVIETTSEYTLREAPGRARKRILEGDVIFATVRPTLLRAACVPAELDNQVCSTAFCVLRRDPKHVADKFLYYLVQRDQFIRQLAEIESGASYPAVTDRAVREQIVPVPSLAEQRDIVAILDTVGHEIDLHRKRLKTLNDLFKTLLEKLMTGGIPTSDLVSAIGGTGDFGTREC